MIIREIKLNKKKNIKTSFLCYKKDLTFTFLSVILTVEGGYGKSHLLLSVKKRYKPGLFEMRSFFKKEMGSVMMEYIIITSVFLLGIGGFFYMDSKFVNLMPGLLPDTVHSPFTIGQKGTDEYMSYLPVEESERNVLSYGAVGNAFAAQSQKAQKVIAMPQL